MENSAPAKIFNIRERTLKFAVKTIQLTALLPKNAAGFAIANQLVRAGTSIGANVEEAQDASTKKEFIHKLTIALGEARETEYWLQVIEESKLIVGLQLRATLQEVNELIKILTSIVKKAKFNQA